MRQTFAMLGAFALGIACTTPVDAHGIVGDRFFPATLTTDDPFAADELALPTVTAFNHERDYDMEYSKTIVPGFAVGIEAGYVDASPPGESKQSGFDNLAITPMVELYRNPDHETIVTGGVIWEIGGSGSRAVADRFSTWTPELLFGKGFGDLPDSVALLRPLAITGQVGFKVPGTGSVSKAVEWGGAVEYSLRYLQDSVRDQGFPTLVTQLTPIVEFSFESPTDHGGGGSTGTFNPGLIWSGRYTQFAVEAVIPANRASGNVIGVVAQMHFYIDDLFPNTFGRPLFGGHP